MMARENRKERGISVYRRFRDKKGISAIVATLIIILLVIVSAGIIWVVIRNIVQSGAEQMEVGSQCMKVSIDAKSVIEDSEGVYSVRLRRDSGGEEIGGIKIILLNETDSSSVQNGFEGLSQLSTKTETFSGPINATKLEYTVYFISDSDKEQNCQQTNTYTIRESTTIGSEEEEEEPDYSWDISFASYDNVNISTQDSIPIGLFFSSDGTNLYEISGDRKIYQYSCTTAWNLSSCGYEDISISTQNICPAGLFFSSDGTKLYETGYCGNKICQSTCDPTWDLSSCIYNGVYIPTQDSYPMNLFFSSDGTKLYEIGSDTNKIYQYTCLDAWTLSSCSYNGINIPTQDSDPKGLFFSSDGTKLYEIGRDGKKIYQYSCTTDWSLTCSYDDISISTQDSVPQGLFFSSDGTKMYEIGYEGKKIYQYTLSGE